MPTNELRPEFLRDYAQLTPEQQLAFRAMVAKFVVDLRTGTFRAGLRIKGVQGHAGVYEVTWAPDGRATFEYGDPVQPGERHVIWRRIGSHDIFDEP